MTFTHHTGGAPDDALLVRYLHGELDAGERSALSQHLDACETCRVRTDALRDRMQRLGATLRAADFEPPPERVWMDVLGTARVRGAARRRSGTWRMAAGWIILAGTAIALLAPPVRAWIAARLAPLTVTTDQVPEETNGIAAGAAAVAFEPDGPELDIDVATFQAAGTLTIRFGEDELARVAVEGGGDEQLTVGSRTLRIDNAPASEASYEVVLPLTVERATVRVAGAVPVIAERARQHVSIALHTAPVRKPASRDEDWQ